MFLFIRWLIRSYKAESTHRFGHFPPGSCYICTRPSVHPRAFVTMASNTRASKRKSDMALLQEDIQTDDFAAPIQSSFSERPRRSGRNINKSGEESKTTHDAGKKSKSRPRSEARKNDMDFAIDGLRDMENNFVKAVKRQKLAVNKSSVLSSPEGGDDGEHAFRPRPVKALPDVMPLKQKKKTPKQTEPLKTEQKPPTPPADNIAAEAADNQDPEADAGDGDYTPEENDANAIKREGARRPPVNSDYLPLPWKGRLGYACLNTYLRQSNPPVFSSRTCRIASIIEHRHPLQDPTQPEHPTKNRPDRDQPADVARGQKYVENLGLANARDIVKMLRWNDKYGIKFMRLSSEMFPFASHEEHGYKLAPFASEVLAEAGKVAAELGHRLTTHPGQFTQLGSPRKEVVRNAARDLEYHDEMLTLLRLPEQQNKDAVMILHMGGVFGDKGATLDRFRENYAKLSESIKARLVLENDDVSWTVHDLLPICEELNIPMVLDFHHHNILFDPNQLREGTKDIMDIYPRIKATWDRKGITQKMHYSEPCSEAVTPRQRRKHRPRVMTLPPCADTMDLMIEAKDKEQAVFDLMRNFKLPGWDTINDIIPYERGDENRPPPKAPKKKPRKKRTAEDEDVEPVEDEPKPLPQIPDSEVGMGGGDNRVYWPIGMEEWLRPKKREVKKKAKAADEGTTNDDD
ncbi:UV-endonuclease UvdE-domain-containing protein [Xylariomycetidae sp. FL2044]|nr:UV-endonuclease UvdE-domain-containing protein [Xylariomycetidae sp. FL2044]